MLNLQNGVARCSHACRPGVRRLVWAWVAIMLAIAPRCPADARRILLDGQFDDWTHAFATTDPIGDVPANGAAVDFVSLRAANDERSLLLEITLTQPRLLQDLNNITLYLDTDLDRATGLAEGDMGAELIWRFGQRVGTNYSSSGAQTVVISDLNLRPAPAVTSARFEMAIPRDLVLFGTPLFTTNAVRLSLRGNGTAGDRIPDTGSIQVQFRDDPLPILPLIPVEKVKSPAFRVVTWNTADAGIFDPARQDQFRRILQALQPDILVLQEMGGLGAGTSRESARELVASWLTHAPVWNVATNGNSRDSVILSRYPILDWRNVFGDGTFSSTAALLDTRAEIGRETLVVAAHLSCCNDDASRDSQVGQIASFIQDARTPGGNFTVAYQTPMILLGDFNLVGKAEQLARLLEGPLVQNTRQAPDWDRTPIALLAARHNAVPDTYTWRANLPGVRFYPSQLDYMLYTDSVLRPLRQFVFHTESLPAAQLVALNLEINDVFAASDHAPVVADFSLAGPILQIERSTAATKLTVSWAPGSMFQIQRSDNLIDWHDLASKVLASGMPTVLVDSEAGIRPSRFYRAIGW